MKNSHAVLFILMLCFAIFVRFLGLNWDQNAHLHPDERFLTMVTTNVAWPQRVQDYFDTNTSLLNPHNRGFGFFVYGTWPVILAKAVATAVGRDTYDGFPLVGRSLAALADVFTVLVVFLLAKQLLKRVDSALLSAALYATSVLPIQLSHFFTVDPFATLLLTISLYLIAKNRLGVPLGIAVGLAISAKISSALFVPIVGVAYLVTFPWKGTLTARRKHLIHWIIQGILCAGAIVVTVRVFYPYLFDGLRLNPKLIANWKELIALNQPTTSFPPGLQWISTTPLNPLLDLVVFGLGLPQGILAVVAVLTYLWHTVVTKRFSPLLISALWIILVYIYQSLSFPKPMRYFYDLYPPIAVLSAWSILELLKRFKLRPLVWYALGIVLLLWPLSFLAIFTKPHTRVAASMWMYTHIPKKATIAWEHWDDPLPLPLPTYIPDYHTVQLPVFNPDSPEKIRELTKLLSQADYLVLSSNRGYGAIGRAQKRFPWTETYYQTLMRGSLGFVLVAQFTSRPTLPVPGISLCIRPPGFTYGALSSVFDQCPKNGITVIDDYADELFTVYDHPKVLIFANEKKMSADELYRAVSHQTL